MQVVDASGKIVQRRSVLGWLGIIAGVLAFAAALLPSRVLPLVVGGKPIEQTVIDKAKELRDRAYAVLKRKEAAAPQPKPADWRPLYAAAAVVLGGTAFVLGILSFVRREDIRAGVGAALFGVAALAFDQLMAALFMFVAIILVVIVMDRKRGAQ